jgi:hypothetical protein
MELAASRIADSGMRRLGTVIDKAPIACVHGRASITTSGRTFGQMHSHENTKTRKKYNDRPLRLLRTFVVLCVLAAVFASAQPADAQEPPPPIPHFVVDLHGTVTTFPSDPDLALSRGSIRWSFPGPVSVVTWPCTCILSSIAQ